MTSEAWWALVSFALSLGGSVWTGTAVDVPWEVDTSCYRLDAYPSRRPGGRGIDFAGRVTRLDKLIPPLVTLEDLATRPRAATVFTELFALEELPGGDIREILVQKDVTHATPESGRFECLFGGMESVIWAGRPMRVRITVKVGSETKSTLTVPAVIRFVKQGS
jgi:hypothetical protein